MISQVIEVESINVETKSRVVRVDKEAAAINANKAQALRSKCEKDLAEAWSKQGYALKAFSKLWVSYISQHFLPSRLL